MILNWFKKNPHGEFLLGKPLKAGVKWILLYWGWFQSCFFVWSAHVRGLLSFPKAGGTGQSEALWLRSLLSVHSSSPSVGGHTEGLLHTNMRTHKHRRAKISGSLCCIYYQRAGMKVKVAVKLGLKSCFCLRGCVCAILCLHPLSEAWTWPTGFLEDTWALIILAVYPPQHVAAMSAKPESVELFTSAAF